MKLLALMGKGVLAAGVAAAGLTSGQWVNQNVHRSAAPIETAPSDTPPPDGGMAAPATVDSLFHYQFTPGETLYYGLNADVRGTGIESLAGAGGVAMAFRSSLVVKTESVDTLGNGYLDIRFGPVEMQGSFMDAPVSLAHSLAGTEFQHGNEYVSTAAGDSIAGIPQLQFFNQPTKATVSPAGIVLEVSGAPGMDKLIAPESLIASVQFPEGDLDPGAQWVTDFGMPVPGIGTPVASTAVNTLDGMDLYRGRYCARIRQKLNAQQLDGTISSPESALGEATGFSMPQFNLQGENVIYFDLDNGQLVDAELQLTFMMQIGAELKAVAGMLSMYGDLLNEIEGIDPSAKPADDLLKLGLMINGRLSLLE